MGLGGKISCARYLFHDVNVSRLAAQAHEDEDDVDTIDEKYSDLIINMDTFKCVKFRLYELSFSLEGILILIFIFFFTYISIP